MNAPAAYAYSRPMRPARTTLRRPAANRTAAACGRPALDSATPRNDSTTGARDGGGRRARARSVAIDPDLVEHGGAESRRKTNRARG